MALRKLKRNRLAGHQMNVELRGHLGEQLVHDICNILREVDFANWKILCAKHNRRCPIWGAPEHLLEKGSDGVIVGHD